MDIERDQGLVLYRFRSLSAFAQLRHAVTTRHGGDSPPPYDSLNLSRNVGDAPHRVAANRQRVQTCFPATRPAFLRQVHGRRVAVLDGGGLPADGYMPGEADAVVTRETGCLLAVLVADCQPVLLFDPVRGVIANIHSGWRGSVANIIGRTVAVMTARFGSRPGDIRAGVGPSLGPCCAEFVNYRREIPPDLWAYRRSGPYFDFWALSRDQLLLAGLQAAHIEIGGICTRCRSDQFFSYRAARRTGRMGAFIGLRPPA
jgi:YfiH family protein